MGRDDDHASHEPFESDDDLDGESHAADEPTAVWDESALRAAGLGDIVSRRETEKAPPPATRAPVRRADASIVVDEAATSSAQPDAPRARLTSQPAAAGGLGWAATIVIAVALGAVMYFVIRHFRG